MLSHNDLQTIDLRYCEDLELLRLANNKLKFDDSIRTLSRLPKLAWIALADNQSSKLPRSAKEVGIEEFVLETRLGEGSSGVSWIAQWGKKRVVVKIFKGGSRCDVGTRERSTFCASDGTPGGEINVSAFVGDRNEYLSKVVAVIRSPLHSGLVFERMPRDMENHLLGGPPNLQTLTRDVYRKRTMDAKVVGGILLDVANAMRFLHSHNIAHGDLYAHNIYYSEEGHAIVGDFGASFVYDPEVVSFEAVEVRAFGILMSELLSQVPEEQADLVHPLAKLRTKTQQKQIALGYRPTFSELVERIEDIKMTWL